MVGCATHSKTNSDYWAFPANEEQESMLMGTVASDLGNHEDYVFSNMYRIQAVQGKDTWLCGEVRPVSTLRACNFDGLKRNGAINKTRLPRCQLDSPCGSLHILILAYKPLGTGNCFDFTRGAKWAKTYFKALCQHCR